MTLRSTFVIVPVSVREVRGRYQIPITDALAIIGSHVADPGHHERLIIGEVQFFPARLEQPLSAFLRRA